MDKLSALMDGELGEHEARAEIARLKEEPQLGRTWSDYHLIGDVLRGEPTLSPRFNERFSARLAAEPTVLAPRRRPARKLATYALSAAASLSAVAMVAWVALSTGNVSTVGDAEIARAPAVLPVPASLPQAASLPSDGSLNEYILAHQGFSPSTAIQGVTPYIRSVAARQIPGTR